MDQKYENNENNEDDEKFQFWDEREPHPLFPNTFVIYHHGPHGIYKHHIEKLVYDSEGTVIQVHCWCPPYIANR